MQNDNFIPVCECAEWWKHFRRTVSRGTMCKTWRRLVVSGLCKPLFTLAASELG